jgi:hypothetical protein
VAIGESRPDGLGVLGGSEGEGLNDDLGPKPVHGRVPSVEPELYVGQGGTVGRPVGAR